MNRSLTPGRVWWWVALLSPAGLVLMLRVALTWQISPLGPMMTKLGISRSAVGDGYIPAFLVLTAVASAWTASALAARQQGVSARTKFYFALCVWPALIAVHCGLAMLLAAGFFWC
jgi:hypothetical protein